MGPRSWLRIEIDGKTVGRIRRGESKDFQVLPGPHKVVSALAGTKSEPLAIETQSGDQLWLLTEAESVLSPRRASGAAPPEAPMRFPLANFGGGGREFRIYVRPDTTKTFMKKRRISPDPESPDP
jgi:hypothetical protein